MHSFINYMGTKTTENSVTVYTICDEPRLSKKDDWDIFCRIEADGRDSKLD